MNEKMKASEEQVVYAGVLDKGMKGGLFILLITFFIYIAELFTPHIALTDLPNYWGMSVHTYLQQANIQAGWLWIGMLSKGDFLNFIGIAVLAGVTILCYLRIIPILFRKRDFIYGLIAIAEVLVLVFAASGVLKTGGH